MSLIVDFANVTPRGIKFKDHFFSNGQAIHDQWFEKAHVEGEWRILIYCFTNEPSVIFYWNGTDLEKGSLIKHNYEDVGKLERYFRSIQLLKSKKLNLK